METDFIFIKKYVIIFIENERRKIIITFSGVGLGIIIGMLIGAVVMYLDKK